MEERDRSRSPSRRTSRVEQVVGRWLRRSRDSSSRERILAEGKAGESSGSEQRSYPVRLTVQVLWDPLLSSHGLSLSPQTPILVQDVTPGGPADGRLVPGDQLVKINNVAVDDLTPEQAADIVRECQDSVTMTVLRTIVGPKSSFITPEKRAILRSNPVKVRFAEEVEVNGHSQGNSLLFLPNVLKVYLENGQTKAFKFEPSTTVKDIVMTLKEKLSLSRIEHFSLVLEQLYSITRLLLLHDQERIQQVVQRREAHDYRCLFRVCFVPRDPQDLLQDDPTSFEYLYLQGVNDVLQERFAVEMRCNTALRLAALHIQERLVSCGQNPKTNLKTITKSWGIENFVSSTLLRNMREKDLRKAISYHMKKSQSQMEPKQKVLSANQARTNYLKELSDLKSFGGKSFSATMMLQDRESTVTLLVGARYGVSQVVNHKLSIMSTLTEFSSITRIELLPESERVSLVKIYLQDIKPITLLLESVAAKDLSCLVAGYCRLLVDSTVNIFPWIDPTKKHRVSAEEGYVSRCGSDSDDSSDLDMDALVTLVSYGGKAGPRRGADPERGRETQKERTGEREGKKEDERRETSSQEAHKKEERGTEEEEKMVISSRSSNGENETLVEAGGGEENRVWKAGGGPNVMTEGETRGGPGIKGGGEERGGEVEKEGAEEDEGGGGGELRAGDDQPSVSEASDSCRTDSRFLTSLSSDSLDALEEDDFISCSSSAHPHLHPNTHPAPHPHLLSPPPPHDHPLFCLAVDPPNTAGEASVPCKGQGGGPKRSGDPVVTLDPVSGNVGFAELSRMADYLPSPPEASEEEEEEEERRERVDSASEAGGRGGEDRSARPLSSASSRLDCVFNFEQSDARCYYNICSNVTPDSARSPPRPHPGPGPEEEGRRGEEQGGALKLECVPILQPPPGFGDSSSDEEFFDASDRFASPEEATSGAVPRDSPGETRETGHTVSPSDIGTSAWDPEREGEEDEPHREEEEEEGGGGGGGREMVSRLRSRSRKRRSFVETDFTSRVSFPEPHLDQDQRNHVAQSDDSQSLSSDPEPSEQSQNPCPTVSSLNHTEGEPAQLESKPILLAIPPCPHRNPDEDRRSDPGSDFKRTSSRARRQEMEMEPDAMESKSVTALVTAASSPSISAVRCRVDPDGKESADRRGDGEEEDEGGKERQEEEEAGPPSARGMFGGHMFLAEIKEEDELGETRGEEEEEERAASPGTEAPLAGVDGGLQTSGPTPRFAKDEEESEDAPPGPRIITTSAPVLCDRASGAARGARRNFSPPSHPPPPPPTCPLPPLPEPSAPRHSIQPEREQGDSRDGGMLAHPPKTCPEEGACGFLTESHSKEPPRSIQSDTTSEGKADVKVNCVPAIVVHSAPEAAISTTSSTLSDGAVASFDSHSGDSEDIASVDLISASNEAAVSTGDRTATTETASTANIEAPHIIHSLMANTPLTSNTDFVTTINCTTAKLDAIAGVKSTSVSTDSTVANVKATISLDFLTVTKTANLTKANIEAQANGSTPNASTAQANVSIATANTSTGHELRKGPLSPTVFLFQPCSPGIIGSRLSASTLRGKIQSLPLYLSRSQETLSQTSLGSTAKVSSGEVDQADPKVTANASTRVGDSTDAEAESDDSEVTLTGSEVEGEVVVETSRAEITRSTMSEVEEVVEKVVMVYENPNPPPICKEPEASNPSPKMDASDPKTDSSGLQMDIPEPKIDTSGSKTDISDPRMNSPVLLCPPAIVVTTQSLNGPGLSFLNLAQPVGGSSVTPSMGHCKPAAGDQGPVKTLGPGCGVFTICQVQPKPQAQPLAQPRPGSPPSIKPDLGCGPTLASGCESVLEGAQAPLGVCGCPAVYTNCFGGEDSFDDELTVYEFSCRTQSGATRASGAELPLMTAPPPSSFLSTSPSSSLSPSFPRSLLAPLSSSSELSPLLSPAEPPDCFLSEARREAVDRLLRRRCYPAPPAGFQALRGDVDQLLALLEGSAGGGRGERHPRDTCPVHFGENKRLLHAEARRLMSGCQRVVRAGQSPAETLLSLADSLQTLVELAGVCLRFSGCERCDRRNSEAVAGLADVARAFRELALAAERASGSRACRDLSTKLLAKQCTALTASVFCLTQLFRTLTAL